MLAPRTANTHRTYGIHPTTSKKNINKENANALPSKTPSRAGGKHLIGPSTGMRIGLGVKTEGRDRNVLQSQMGGKGKGKEGDEIEPKRLFTNAPKGGIPPSKSLSSMPPIPALPARTPGPRRAAPSQTLRTPAPSLRFSAEPAPTPLPSATRARRRSRQSLSSNSDLSPDNKEGEKNKMEFKTPAPVKWDEELSLGSIEVDHLEGLEEVEEEEDGEPEYMPPPVQELPYDPGWDVPDLGAMCSKMLMPGMQAGEHYRPAPPEFTFTEQRLEKIVLQDDESLEVECLRQRPKVLVQSAKPQSRLTNRPLSRPTTSIRPTPLPSTRATSTRPASTTSTSTRRLAVTPLSRPTSTSNPSAISRPTTSNRSRPPAPVPRPPRPTSKPSTITVPRALARPPMRPQISASTEGTKEKKAASKDEQMRQADNALLDSFDLGGRGQDDFELDLALDLGMPEFNV